MEFVQRYKGFSLKSAITFPPPFNLLSKPFFTCQYSGITQVKTSLPDLTLKISALSIPATSLTKSLLSFDTRVLEVSICFFIISLIILVFIYSLAVA